MRLHALATFLMLAGALAGCADGTDPVVHGVDPADLHIAALEELIQRDRPVVAKAVIHEDPAEGSMDIPDIDGATTWESRDVDLTYHGVAETYDEWGRPVPAHVFRYEPMRLVVDDVEVGPVGASWSGHYEPVLVEYYFDIADGRFMGRADLGREVRNFASPDDRHPFAFGYESSLFLFMMPYFLDGDLDRPVQMHGFDRTYNYTLEPYQGERPMAGDCDAYQLIVDDGREEPVESAEEQDPREKHRTLVCFDGFLPRWTWQGSEADGAMRMERTMGDFSVPGPAGDALAPYEYERAPMDRIDPPLGLPVAPTYVPPSTSSVDWARALAERAEAMYLSPGYLEYGLRHDELYLRQAITGWPPHSILWLAAGIGIVQDAPVNVHETSWMMTTEGPGMYWLNVHEARYGEAGVMHYPDVQGGESTGLDDEHPSREEIGDILVVDRLQTRVPDLAPAQPRVLNYHVWPDFGDDMGAQRITWWAMENCFEQDDDARFLAFSGVDGRLYGAGKMVSEPNGCSASTFALAASAFDAVQVVPPTSTRPAMLLHPDGGVDLGGMPVLPASPAEARGSAWPQEVPVEQTPVGALDAGHTGVS